MHVLSPSESPEPVLIPAIPLRFHLLDIPDPKCAQRWFPGYAKPTGMARSPRHESVAPNADRPRQVLVISIIVTVCLYLIPYGDQIGYPLALLSTLFHELGHGVAALLVGADFEALRLYSDGSGIAVSSGNVGNLARATISAGGLIGPALASGLFLLLARRPPISRFGIFGLGAVLMVAEILVVDNIFGLVFVGTVAMIFIAIAVLGSSQIAQLTTVFVAVQLALSVYSSRDYLFTQYAQTAEGTNPSDVENMAQALILPYWFWGGFCGVLSFAILLMCSWHFLRIDSTAKPSK